jgi:hypothetical protein
MSNAWYWCLDHNEVEQEEGCPNDRRMGPYETYDQAATALGRAHERTKEWDDVDAEWED